MRSSIEVIHAQIVNWRLIIRISRFERKANYASYKIGRFWEILNPCIQVAIYYLIFGVAMNKGTVSEHNIPYILWLLAGIIPWFYISSNITQGANSIYSQLSIISKTNMPTAIIPTVVLVNNMPNFIIMGSLLLLFSFLSHYLLYIQFYWLVYYTIAMIIFVFSLNILTSTITIIFKDFKLMLNSAMRLLIFVSGVIVQFNLSNDRLLYKILQLNPIMFLIKGFRFGMFGIGQASIKEVNHLYFWNFVLIIYSIGAFIHTRYRYKYNNYI